MFSSQARETPLRKCRKGGGAWRQKGNPGYEIRHRAPEKATLTPETCDFIMSFMMVAPAPLTASCLDPEAAPPDWSKSWVRAKGQRDASGASGASGGGGAECACTTGSWHDRHNSS